MSLAQDLLKDGDSAPVLRFLEMSRQAWPSGTARLDDWERKIRAGRIPDFGANLLY